MTAAAFASMVHARPSGRGRWRARCPIHKSRGLSLAIYEGRDWVMLTCFAGCDYDTIIGALGLKKSDMAIHDRPQMTSAERRALEQRVADEKELARLRRVDGLLCFMRALEPNAERWKTEILATQRAGLRLMHRLHPEKKAEYDLQVKIKRVGIDAMWNELIAKGVFDSAGVQK